MGFMDKFKNYVDSDGFEGEEEYYDEQDDYENDEPAPVTSANHSFGSSTGVALELKVIRPERFEAVTGIADHLLQGRTVVLNLEATNKETSRRMIDFLSGVAYSIEGNLKKVANNTFVITPGNVAVSNDAAQAFQAQAAQAAPAAAPSEML